MNQGGDTIFDNFKKFGCCWCGGRSSSSASFGSIPVLSNPFFLWEAGALNIFTKNPK